VRAFIANTDYEWYRFLIARPDIDEVNFWRPGTTNFQALVPGEPLLFRLKTPYNAIAGVGFFVKFSILPASFAWAVFGIKNGAASEQEMRARIEKYRRRFRRASPVGREYDIGCIVLAQPTFFQEQAWVAEPHSWPSTIVAGRTEDLTRGDGTRIWSDVMHRLRGSRIGEPPVESARYGAEIVIRPRLGQGAFRVLVTDTYSRRCAVTGERTLPVLEAAHIRPYALGGEHKTANGLLLRSDLHTLFDGGYITVTSKHQLEISPRIREEFENGRDYYALHGKRLRIPTSEKDHPDPGLLEWHNLNVYRT
jgi:putative restriction endonuclease